MRGEASRQRTASAPGGIARPRGIAARQRPRLAVLTTFFALAAPAQAAAPQRVLVEATEFRFTLSRTTVKPGAAIVQLAIRGEDPHDLKLRPLGKVRARIASVPETLPGGVAEWRGKLSKGRWELYCSLQGHKRAGMRTVLEVR